MLVETPENAKTRKVQNLEKLSQNFKVPKWFYVGSRIYESFIERTGLKNRIEEKLKFLNRANYEEISADIQKMIAFEPMPYELEQAILSHYQNNLVAVRAAFTIKHEELNQIAFLNISSKEKLINAIKVSFSMKYMTSAMKLRLEENIDFDVEVIIQDMVQSNISGIVFSKDVFSNTDTTIIKSCLGLGIGLSNNEITGEIILLNNENITKMPFEQESAYVLNRTKTQTEKIHIGSTGKLPKLSEDMAIKILNISKQIEDIFKLPQKISFSIVGNEIYILSASSLIEEKKEEVNIMDDEFIPLDSIISENNKPEEKNDDVEFILPIVDESKDLAALKNLIREMSEVIENLLIIKAKDVLGTEPSDIDDAITAVEDRFDTSKLKKLFAAPILYDVHEEELKELFLYGARFIVDNF